MLITAFMSLYAQQEQSLHFMRNTWQSNLTNPAMKLSEKVEILLPSIYYNLSSPDFKIKKLIMPDADGVLDLSALAKNRLELRNRLNVDAKILTLGVAVPINENLSISLYHSINNRSSIDLDGSFLKMTLDDNFPYVGKTHNFYSKVNGSVYGEIGLGAVYLLNRHIQIGIQLKKLDGMMSIFTKTGESIVTLETTNYAMSMNNNINFNTYSLDHLNEMSHPFKALGASFLSKNNGYAFDLGTSMEFGKFNVAFSIIDIGSHIKWQKEGKNYTSLGNFHYKGIKSATISIENTNNNSLTGDLKEVIQLKETNDPKYVEKFPTKLYVSTSYDFSDKLMVGALIFRSSYQYFKSQTGVTLNTTYRINDNLHLGGTWSLRNNSVNNLGIHMMAQLGPIQLYGVTDNIITAFRPYNSNNSNGRLGINILL